MQIDILTLFPAVVWAQELSNADLYKMILKLEARFDAAMAQTQTALAEADKAKAEAAAAKEEAAKAKAELARLKATPAPESNVEAVAEKSLVRVPTTGPRAVVSFENIYLRPGRSGLDFAVLDEDQVGPDSIAGRYIDVDPGYSPGYRVGISFETDSGMDFGVRGSRITGEDSASASIDPAASDLWGTWLHANSIIDDNDVTSADATYEWKQTVADISVGQRLNVGEKIDLRLEAGLRHAKVNQEFDISYVQDVTSTLYRASTIDNKNEFTGWGPRFGIDFDWKMGLGFDLFGSLGGSLLMGDFDVSYTELDKAAGAVNWTTRVEVEESYDHRLIPVAEARVGIGYAYQLKNGLQVGAKFGYEWQNWFNMVTSQGYMDDVDSQLMETDTTDLSFYGYFFEGFLQF